MMTIELPDNVETRLALLALKTGRSKQFYAREAILEYLDDVEARYLAIHRSGQHSVADFDDPDEFL